MLGEEPAQHPIVVRKVFPQPVEPLLAPIIRGHQRLHAERIDVAHLVVIDRAVDSGPHVGIGRDDIGDLHSGQIERLAGRVAGNRAMQKIVRQRSERGIVVPLIGQLAVNFVRHDAHAVTEAYLAEAAQLFPGPHPAHGVVRIAQQKQLGLRIGSLRLQIVEVDRIRSAFVAQPIGQ